MKDKAWRYTKIETTIETKTKIEIEIKNRDVER